MGLRIEGAAEFERKLADIGRRFPQARDKFLKQEAELVKGRAALRTPVGKVKGGTLRAAWSRTQPAGGRIEVYNNTDYAAHVEYGHRLKKRKTKEWLRDKTGKLKFVPGVKMLEQAIDTTRGTIQADARKILGDLFK